MRKNRPLAAYIAAAILSASRHPNNSMICYFGTQPHKDINEVFSRWYGVSLPEKLIYQAIEILISWGLVKKRLDAVIGISYDYRFYDGVRYFERKRFDKNDIFYYVHVYGSTIVQETKAQWLKSQGSYSDIPKEDLIKNSFERLDTGPSVSKPTTMSGSVDWTKSGAIAAWLGILVALAGIAVTLL